MPDGETSSSSAETPVKSHRDGCTLSVRVQAGARQTAITGIYCRDGQSYLHISLQAFPVDGKANEALIDLIHASFGLPRSCAQILRGEHDRYKILLLHGAGKTEIDAAVRAQLQPQPRFLQR